jgi:S1-C subfamily serine protease
MSFGALPVLRSIVETYGYPVGGQRISSTKGVVSRIEFNQYMHSGVDYHLTVQTDAAINPGNSGGPVIQDNKVAGVAFQNLSKMDNISFFIPTEIVHHFLSDLEDGAYDGYPDLGIQTVNMQNPAARLKAMMDEKETGVRIDLVNPDTSSDGYLFEGDVILNAEGHDIANDGTVDLKGLRLNFGVLIDRNQVGDSTELTVLRKGEKVKVAIPMKSPLKEQRYANIYDQLPRYYVYAGLVFIPLNRESINLLGSGIQTIADYNLLYEYLFKNLEHPEEKKDEPVILLRRLDHSVNADMAWDKNLVVDKVNGRPINRLEDLIVSIETNTDQFHVIEFGYQGRFVVLDRAAADLANTDILEQYAVPKDRRL